MVYIYINKVYIYLIKDNNGLLYVGSTDTTLEDRLRQHKYDRNFRYGKCSSCLLNLDNCSITTLEECDKDKRKEKESFWINKMDCVNTYKLNYDDKKYKKQYHIDNLTKRKGQMKNHYEEKKEYYKKKSNDLHHYQSSWGGDKRTNNNLLLIDITIFQ